MSSSLWQGKKIKAPHPFLIAKAFVTAGRVLLICLYIKITQIPEFLCLPILKRLSLALILLIDCLAYVAVFSCWSSLYTSFASLPALNLSTLYGFDCNRDTFCVWRIGPPMCLFFQTGNKVIFVYWLLDYTHACKEIPYANNLLSAERAVAQAKQAGGRWLLCTTCPGSFKPALGLSHDLCSIGTFFNKGKAEYNTHD